MAVHFRHHDILRLFVEIAHYNSFSDAADALNMTKGAISYQIKTLEADLGLRLFDRTSRGVSLTHAGHRLLGLSQSPFGEIESGISHLKGEATQTLTVGVSTYFAARWLSARLMSFMQAHQDIQLRIQPMIQVFDLEKQGVDIAIRWGSGDWNDVEITPFMAMPAFPVGNLEAFERVAAHGLRDAIAGFTLLRDHDDSDAWSDWLHMAQLPLQTRRDVLIIPDPNVRVQAVIDGQGIALMDDLIHAELDNRQLFQLSPVALTDYGYFLAKPRSATGLSATDMFVEWVLEQSTTGV